MCEKRHLVKIANPNVLSYAKKVMYNHANLVLLADLNSIFEKVLDYVIPASCCRQEKPKLNIKRIIYGVCVDKSFNI